MTEESIKYKKTLKYLLIVLFSSIVVINVLILAISDEHLKKTTAIITLNITAGIASTLGVIAVIRYGIHGNHGKSYLFLTVGIILWFFADLHILYSHIVLGVDEQEKISVTDALWLSGYLFLILHMVSIIKIIGIKNLSKTFTIAMVIIIGFILMNVISTYTYTDESQENNTREFNTQKSHGLTEVVVTILYPVLDLSLMIPAAIILLNLFREYQHSVPLVLASLSLFVNAVADNGYTIEFIKGKASALPWDLFYISDFIIMAGALFWYNKFHIQQHRLKKEIKK